MLTISVIMACKGYSNLTIFRIISHGNKQSHVHPLSNFSRKEAVARGSESYHPV